MYDRLLEILGELGAATCQMIPSDDRIICDHVRKAEELTRDLAKAVLREKVRNRFWFTDPMPAPQLRVAGADYLTRNGTPKVREQFEDHESDALAMMAEYREAKGR